MKKECIIKTDIISERGLNRLLVGISKRRGYHNIEFPYKITHETGNGKHDIIMSDFWNYNNFLLVDYIGHVIVNNMYKNVSTDDTWKINYIPKTPKNSETNKFITEIVSEKCNFEIRKTQVMNCFNMSYIIKETDIRAFYPFNLLYGHHIEDIFKSIKNCMFSLHYPIKVYNKQIEKYSEILYYIDNEHLFDYTLHSYRTTPTGKIVDKKYKITFDTYFGAIFIYNLLCINFDWFPNKPELFKLRETDQLIYRRYILSRNGFKTLKFKDDTMISGLGYRNPCKKENIATIKISLNNLKNISIIKNWTYDENGIFTIYK